MCRTRSLLLAASIGAVTLFTGSIAVETPGVAPSSEPSSESSSGARSKPRPEPTSPKARFSTTIAQHPARLVAGDLKTRRAHTERLAKEAAWNDLANQLAAARLSDGRSVAGAFGAEATRTLAWNAVRLVDTTIYTTNAEVIIVAVLDDAKLDTLLAPLILAAR